VIHPTPRPPETDPEARFRQRVQQVARELSLGVSQVEGALTLFREGSTLPFIARYRKEATGGLDEIQLRDVRDRAEYLEVLEDRRSFILQSIADQGKLTPELERAIGSAETKQALEDLYLPYRPRRKTRGTVAVERGLLPLADRIWAGAEDDRAIQAAARTFVSEEAGVPDADAALQGARDILAERLAEDAGLRGRARDLTRAGGWLASRVLRGKQELPEAARFQDYFEHREPLAKIPSHRVLAIRRGEAEGILAWVVEGPEEEVLFQVERVALAGRSARETLRAAARDAVERVLAPSIASELLAELKETADREAIRVFGLNLEQLLLQPPAGERSVLGLDPGFRTGVKAAMVSRTGAVVRTHTLYLHQPDRFTADLVALVLKHRPELIAIGNGTASRETQTAVREALRTLQEPPAVTLVNEAGASVYSASELARDELPGMDVSLRGAVSIARRLQDPLAELVKIDPRSIGVGQYQHDVHQPSLRSRLDSTVELCVNRVGVEVNTASAALLSYVSGLGPSLARGIVETRERKGRIRTRRDLLGVPRLGPRAFEQAAGFLRIRDGEHPLDATAVHPERYVLVEQMARDLGVGVSDLLRDPEVLARLERRIEGYVTPEVGLPTLTDILEELRRPGRDPRETFEPPAFRDDLQTPADLKPGMRIPGVITNVVAFGAFVDVGVHQDGLVHVSQLADRFVKDPSEVVRVGDRVSVTVLEVDLKRNRISLSLRSAPKA
jgi:protein Tex